MKTGLMEMNEQKIVNLLHLARKAGKLQFGYDACERSCRSGLARLLLVAADLAQKQKQKVQIMAEECKIDFLEFGSKQKFGEEFKTRNLGVFSVEDRNFAKGIIAKFTLGSTSH